MFAESVEISPMSAGKPKFRAFCVVAFKTRNYIGGLLKSDFQSDLNGPTAVRWLFRAGGLLSVYIVILFILSYLSELYRNHVNYFLDAFVFADSSETVGSGKYSHHPRGCGRV